MPPPREGGRARPWGWGERPALFGIAALYLIVAALVIYTKAPWCDEAWYATPGWNLLTRGHLGTSALDPTSTSWKDVKLDGIDRHTYWAMPLQFLAEVPWYWAFGFSLFTARALSAAWGLAALLAWHGVMLELSGERKVALATVFLLACDYFFLNGAADARMDMMSAALAAMAALVYLRWRVRNWTVALAAGNAFAAAAVFTHPNGGILAILGLACLVWSVDRKQIRLRRLLPSAIPYFVGLAAWGVYIMQNPAAFRAQFFSAAAARSEPFSLWTALTGEAGRYLRNFGFASWDRPAAHVAFAAPLAYAAAFIFCASRREIRRRPGYRALLIWAGLYLLYMTFFEGLKTYLYLIYIVPLLTGILAVAVMRVAAVTPRLRVTQAAVILLAAIPLARTARRIAADDYHRSYIPAMDFIREHRAGGAMVMGSAESGFRLGFDGVVDDILLGYRSGKRPDYIVIDRARYGDNIEELRRQKPDAYAHATRLLRESYQPVYRIRGYTIYARSSERPRRAM